MRRSRERAGEGGMKWSGAMRAESGRARKLGRASFGAFQWRAARFARGNFSRVSRTVLHYTGSDDDRGGVMSVLRALAGAGRFECVLGVNPGFVQRRTPPLPALEFPRIDGETIGAKTSWRARAVARAVQSWLAEDRMRVFHAHSRAGLVAALWLARAGERRVVASVHCYGRQRWFYRWAARQLSGRLYWLSPAMKRHYGVAAGEPWSQCIPGCVPAPMDSPPPRKRDPARLRLGGVGALVEWKGWHLVLAAFAQLPPAIRARVRFEHIGGAGPDAASQRYAARLRAATAAHGLDAAVMWRGEQASSAAFLREIACLVVASDHEPFSIAVLEALAAGVPVLAADTGGAQDLIERERSGWFFRSGEASALAVAIERLTRAETWARIDVGPDSVRRFTAPVIAERWERVYAAL